MAKKRTKKTLEEGIEMIDEAYENLADFGIRLRYLWDDGTITNEQGRQMNQYVVKSKKILKLRRVFAVKYLRKLEK